MSIGHTIICTAVLHYLFRCFSIFNWVVSFLLWAEQKLFHRKNYGFEGQNRQYFLFLLFLIEISVDKTWEKLDWDCIASGWRVYIEHLTMLIWRYWQCFLQRSAGFGISCPGVCNILPWIWFPEGPNEDINFNMCTDTKCISHLKPCCNMGNKKDVLLDIFFVTNSLKKKYCLNLDCIICIY